MKISEIRELSSDELLHKQEELQDQLFKLKFQHAMGQLENAMKLKSIRKDLARIKTVINEMSKGTE